MTMTILNWTEATEAVDTAKSILLVTHIKPDGDAIGSLLGLANALRERGSAVTTLAVDEGVPNYLRFLPGADGVVPLLTSGEWELMISLDASDEERTGDCGRLRARAQPARDQRRSSPDQYAVRRSVPVHAGRRFDDADRPGVAGTDGAAADARQRRAAADRAGHGYAGLPHQQRAPGNARLRAEADAGGRVADRGHAADARQHALPEYRAVEIRPAQRRTEGRRDLGGGDAGGRAPARI